MGVHETYTLMRVGCGFKRGNLATWFGRLKATCLFVSRNAQTRRARTRDGRLNPRENTQLMCENDRVKYKGTYARRMRRSSYKQYFTREKAALGYRPAGEIHRFFC